MENKKGMLIFGTILLFFGLILLSISFILLIFLIINLLTNFNLDSIVEIPKIIGIYASIFFILIINIFVSIGFIIAGGFLRLK